MLNSYQYSLMNPYFKATASVFTQGHIHHILDFHVGVDWSLTDTSWTKPTFLHVKTVTFPCRATTPRAAAEMLQDHIRPSPRPDRPTASRPAALFTPCNLGATYWAREAPSSFLPPPHPLSHPPPPFLTSGIFFLLSILYIITYCACLRARACFYLPPALLSLSSIALSSVLLALCISKQPRLCITNLKPSTLPCIFDYITGSPRTFRTLQSNFIWWWWW